MAEEFEMDNYIVNGDDDEETGGWNNRSLDYEIMESRYNNMLRHWGATSDETPNPNFVKIKDNHIFVNTDRGLQQMTHKNNSYRFISFNEAKKTFRGDGGNGKIFRYT